MLEACLPGDSHIVFLVVTCFLIRDYRVLRKKEVHGSLQVEAPSNCNYCLLGLKCYFAWSLPGLSKLTWTLRVCKLNMFWDPFRGLGPLTDMLSGSRYSSLLLLCPGIPHI